MARVNNPITTWRHVPEVRIPHRSLESVIVVLQQAAELIVSLSGDNVDTASRTIVDALDELRRVAY
jgi:hypothetical protein